MHVSLLNDCLVENFFRNGSPRGSCLSDKKSINPDDFKGRGRRDDIDKVRA